MPSEHDQFSNPSGRQPTSTEWNSDIMANFKNFGSEESGKFSSKIQELIGTRPTFSRNWRPKEWFPVPWNTEQLQRFDSLPTLGFLHRPVFVKMTDAQGSLLTKAEEREVALQKGWLTASAMLPNETRDAGPTRVIVATGGKASQLVDFHGMLRRLEGGRDSKFDPANPIQFIDVDHRVGNTGAATFFMQAAIGVLGSYSEGGVSAAFNLRDPREASIIFISPPSEGIRRSQQHVLGGDVFQSATIPSVDPKNYEQP